MAAEEQLKRLEFLKSLIDRSPDPSQRTFTFFQHMARSFLHDYPDSHHQPDVKDNSFPSSSTFALCSIPIGFHHTTGYSSFDMHKLSCRAKKRFAAERHHLVQEGDLLDICIRTGHIPDWNRGGSYARQLSNYTFCVTETVSTCRGVPVELDDESEKRFIRRESLTGLGVDVGRLWIISDNRLHLEHTYTDLDILWWKRSSDPPHVFLPTPPILVNTLFDHQLGRILSERLIRAFASFVYGIEAERAEEAERAGEVGEAEEAGEVGEAEEAKEMRRMIKTYEIANDLQLLPPNNTTINSDSHHRMRSCVRNGKSRLPFVELMMGKSPACPEWPYVLPAQQWEFVLQDMVVHEDVKSVKYILTHVPKERFSLNCIRDCIKLALINSKCAYMQSINYRAQVAVSLLETVFTLIFDANGNDLHANGEEVFSYFWLIELTTSIQQRYERSPMIQEDIYSVLIKYFDDATRKRFKLVWERRVPTQDTKRVKC